MKSKPFDKATLVDNVRSVPPIAEEIEDWKYEANNGDTRLGMEDWTFKQRAERIEDGDEEMHDRAGLSLFEGSRVSASPKDGDFAHKFTGTVCGTRNGRVTVRDQEGNAYECDQDQLLRLV